MQDPALDDIDRMILDMLQEDSGITNVELARRLAVAPATTLDRVKKLEQKGIIRGYVALVDPHAVGQGTIAFVAVTLVSHEALQVRAFRDNVRLLKEVLECYHTSGENDYLLKVVVEDIQHYEEFLTTKLVALPNVARVNTSFALSTVKFETKIPINQRRGGFQLKPMRRNR